MAAEYTYIGVPVLNKEKEMTHSEDIKFCVSSMDDYDFKIECLKFEGGTPFPEILSKQPHVVYRVNDLDHYTSRAQGIIFGPADYGPDVRLAFIVWDDVIVELREEK